MYVRRCKVSSEEDMHHLAERMQTLIANWKLRQIKCFHNRDGLKRVMERKLLLEGAK